MKVGYSRISDDRQAGTDPLAQARFELERAGCELILLETGSGTSDTHRPEFRRLQEMVATGAATTVVCPSQDRLGRNLRLVLDFVETCQRKQVPLLDLNGRLLEVKTADGRLMTTLLGALDEHRSALYGEKTERHLQAARDQGFPARPHIPFGLRKIRNDAGRFVAIDIDPTTGPQALERVEWFLETNTRRTLLRMAESHGVEISANQLHRWLRSPLLTGRLAWKRNKQCTGYEQVQKEPSFPALIDDETFQRIQAKLTSGKTVKALRGRAPKPLTGICRCADCGKVLGHKTNRGNRYLVCGNDYCKSNNKLIHLDRVFGVMQYALAEHARVVAPLLDLPQSDPPQVMTLQQEISVLEAIAGTEAVVAAKREEIARLRGWDVYTPIQTLITALKHPGFWLQDDQPLNDDLRRLIDRVVVQLGQRVSDSVVTAVQCRTNPAEAPLPTDQGNIEIPIYKDDIRLPAWGHIGAALVA